jgi:hypothetical protein
VQKIKNRKFDLMVLYRNKKVQTVAISEINVMNPTVCSMPVNYELRELATPHAGGQILPPSPTISP